MKETFFATVAGDSIAIQRDGDTFNLAIEHGDEHDRSSLDLPMTRADLDSLVSTVAAMVAASPGRPLVNSA